MAVVGQLIDVWRRTMTSIQTAAYIALSTESNQLPINLRYNHLNSPWPSEHPFHQSDTLAHQQRLLRVKRHSHLYALKK
ncbi:hypothetical protein D9613_002350 [Agrocybe pediades]|uniref:Uncharacterized protein n=1 Tax=Agrocybe pediades TaxID=84607 RepID=A0A8H4R6I4_9AGAR|nr:hypothetical protein D9613_002350 [Agrocybe pediades]